MDLTILTGLAGLGAGLAAAGLAGPVACAWPAKRGAMVRRVAAVKLYQPLGWTRKAAGGAVVALLLTGGALTAYAAAPSAAAWQPSQLPTEVRGVVGSGDQLSLQVKADGVDRMVRPGEVYRDGWILQALTPSEATLGREGASVRVGLNPTGALASSAPQTGAEVTVTLSDEERAILARLRSSGAWNGLATPGLTLEQTQRVKINTARLNDAFAAKQRSNGAVGAFQGLTADEVRAVIGPAAFDEQVALSSAQILAGRAQLPFTQPLMGIGFDVVSDGVEVTYIEPGSSAARAGLAAGDFIVKVNGENAVTQTNRRMAGDEILSRNPLAYTLSTGKVITVQPENYRP